MAPAIDFARNYATMHTKGLKESDQFFHCKANYEATTEAKQGKSLRATCPTHHSKYK